MLGDDEIRAALHLTADRLTVPDDLLASVFHRAAVVRRRRRTTAGAMAAFALVGGAAVPTLRERIDSLTVLPPTGGPDGPPAQAATASTSTDGRTSRRPAWRTPTPAATGMRPATAGPVPTQSGTGVPGRDPSGPRHRREPLGWPARGVRAGDAALVARTRAALGDPAGGRDIAVLWAGDLTDGTTSLLFEVAVGDGTVERWHYSERNGVEGSVARLYAGSNADQRDRNAVLTDPSQPRLLVLRAPGTLYATWHENISADGGASGPHVEHRGADVDGLTIFAPAPDGNYWTDLIRVHHSVTTFFEEYLPRPSGQ